MQNYADTKTTTNPLQATTSDTATTPIMTNNPSELFVIKRNGKTVPYDEANIRVAITKAFLAVEGGHAAASERVHTQVEQITKKISDNFKQRSLYEGNTIHIESIQDQVELSLMRTEDFKVARAYVLYREEHRRARAEKEKAHSTEKPALHITLDNGKRIPLDVKSLTRIVEEACTDLTDVEASYIVKDTQRNLFDGVSIHDAHKAMILSARTMIEKEPNYSFVAARLLLHVLHFEGLQHLGLPVPATINEVAPLYPEILKRFVAKGIELDRLDARLADFDLETLGNAIQHERNFQFTYLGLQTLYDRYFIHDNETRYELPQIFFMRVAMGLSLNEKNKTERAIEFYNLLSSFDFMSSTPTLFNSGTVRSQLASCFLTTVPDDLDNIYSALRDNALLSKFAGGLGNDWTPVRAMGSYIKGTNGKSSGIVPFLNVADATAVAVNQGGKRKGAVCAYLETWHLDIEEFLDLRKNTGDERRRTHDMNTANWVPDLFMQRMHEDKVWTLFSPDETPELHDLHGEAFAKAYVAYEEKAARGEIRNFKQIPALSLWRKMLTMLFETGHPWITFKDPCNVRSPQQHCGVVHSSNLCTEITLNTSKDEIAVCNLGSINLPQHITENGLDIDKLRATVKTAVRMLDNVIDINYYSVPQARNANLRHRPIGLGLMGFQDSLYKQNLAYGSQEAITFADHSMEAISYYAIQASSDLAQERGSYETYEGSLWSQGTLPIDSIKLLAKSRGEYLEQDQTSTLDWDALRSQIRTKGMRNSNVLAIAPTATISNICGVSQSIEPTYQNLYVKSNLSGEFTVVNPYLINELKQLKLWDDVMVNDLKYFNGSVQQIDRIPEDIKHRYATSFEIDARWLVEAGSRRQKWIDQSQSLNLYMAQASGKKLDELYRLAWTRGLKTTYYLRSLAATSAEKATINDRSLNAVQQNDAPQACAIDDPECEACQ